MVAGGKYSGDPKEQARIDHEEKYQELEARAGRTPTSSPSYTDTPGVVQISPQQDIAWGTYAPLQGQPAVANALQQQALQGKMITPALLNSISQMQGMQPQQQAQPVTQQPAQVPFYDLSLWEQYKAMVRGPQVDESLPAPPSGGAAPLTASDIQDLSIVGGAAAIPKKLLQVGAKEGGEIIAGATARGLGLSWRDLLLNPRLIDEYIKTGALTVEKAKVLREGIRELVKTTIKITQPGELLMKEGGEEILASTVKPALATATKEAVNAVTEKLKGSLIKKWALSNGAKVLGIGTIYKYISNSESAQKELTKHLEESMELRRLLIESGDPEMMAMADELAREEEQLEADLDKWYINFPFGGANDKIQEAKRQVNEANNEFEKYKAAAEKKAVQDQLEADEKILSKIPLMSDEERVADPEIIAAANTNPFIKQLYMDAQQRILDTIKRKEQRLYEEAKSEADKRYIESQKQEQRTYTEAVAEEAEGGGLNWWGSW